MPRQTNRGPDPKDLGQLLVDAYERLGLTQADTWRRTGILPGQLSELPSGKLLSLRNFVVFCEGLGISASEVLRDSDPELLDAARRLERVLGRGFLDFLEGLSDAELKRFYEGGRDAVHASRYRGRSS